MINNTTIKQFEVELRDNITAIGSLIAEVNVDNLDSKVSELITRLLTLQHQKDTMAKILETQATELNNTILRNDDSVNVTAHFLSTFIEKKGMAEEFMAYALSNKTAVKLLDVEALAQQSFTSLAFQGEQGQDQQTAQKQTIDIYNSIKYVVSPEVKNVLSNLDDAYEAYTYAVAKEAYIDGFANAFSAIKGGIQ